MVIKYLDIKRITISPNEADAILIIDTNTVLSLPISFQRFKVIPRKDCEIAQHMRGVQLHQLTFRDSGDLVKPPRGLAFK
jgi:hypothetical protein